MIMVVTGVVLLLLSAVTIAIRPFGRPLQWAARGAAMVGYVAIFLAILSTVYMRELYGFLGRPFLWAHHTLTISGLILIILHPTLLAIQFASVSIYVPVFDSWRGFWLNGGRPALYLFALGAAGALMRRTWRKNWRILHMFTYVAFLLATIHSVLIGTDFGQPILRFLPLAMAVIVVAAFVKKRLYRRRKSSGSR